MLFRSISNDYPLTTERAAFIDIVRTSCHPWVSPESPRSKLGVKWYEYGANEDLWLNAALVRIAVANSPVSLTCLHRSLALWWLLRGQGVLCDLRLGASTADGPFEAHAWVQCGGVALNERDAHLSRYSPLGEAVVPVGPQSRRLPPARVP